LDKGVVWPFTPVSVVGSLKGILLEEEFLFFFFFGSDQDELA
jgi:hypothetical protein